MRSPGIKAGISSQKVSLGWVRVAEGRRRPGRLAKVGKVSDLKKGTVCAPGA
jgi:hypothetical protein